MSEWVSGDDGVCNQSCFCKAKRASWRRPHLPMPRALCSPAFGVETANTLRPRFWITSPPLIPPCCRRLLLLPPPPLVSVSARNKIWSGVYIPSSHCIVCRGRKGRCIEQQWWTRWLAFLLHWAQCSSSAPMVTRCMLCKLVYVFFFFWKFIWVCFWLLRCWAEGCALWGVGESFGDVGKSMSNIQCERRYWNSLSNWVLKSWGQCRMVIAPTILYMGHRSSRDTII